MNRRSLVLSIVAGARLLTARENVSATEEFVEVASPQHATRIAWSYFNNVSKDNLFEDVPLGISCVVYEFESDADSEDGFVDISAHIEEQLGYLMDEDSRLKEVSVGKIGDERIAFLAEDSALSLWAAVRVGSQILTVLALSLSGNPSQYVSEWLTGYLAENDDDESLLPDIDDMPAGWSLKNGPNEVVVDGTPVATP